MMAYAFVMLCGALPAALAHVPSRRKDGRGWGGVELSEDSTDSTDSTYSETFLREEKVEKLSKVVESMESPSPDADFTKEIDCFDQARI